MSQDAEQKAWDAHDVQDLHEALRSEQERLSRLVGAAPGAVISFRLQPAGQLSFVYVSPQAEQIYGFLPEELLADAGHIVRACHPDDRQRVLQNIQDSARTLAPWGNEFRHHNPKRGLRWLEGHAQPEREADGSVVWHGFVIDVTERKRLERQLRLRSEALENALTAFGIVTPDGRFVYVNKMYLRMWGYDSLEEVMRTRVIEHCAEPALVYDVVRAMRARGHCSVEFTARRKDGSTFEALVAIHKGLNEDGEEIFVGTGLDITERKRAEEELRKAGAQLSAALQAGRMGTWRADLSSGQVWICPRFLGLLGIAGSSEPLTVDEAMGYIHPEDRAAAKGALTAFHQNSSAMSMQFRLIGAGGAVHWVSSRGEGERDAAGNMLRVHGVITDITAQKQAEEAMLRSQKLEALGTLAGGIAHDFNNILLAISANTVLATEDLAPSHPAQDYLKEIGVACSRATGLVQRILAFSRPQDQKRELVRLPAVVEEVLKLLRATTPAMIQFRTDFASDLPAIWGDPTQIHQLIVNLGANAAHAIGAHGGAISLRIEPIDVTDEQANRVSGLRAGRYVRLTVSDTGPGIDPETLKRVFDPFFTTKPPGEGTGLGLSVVHGLMKSLDGAVSVTSDPGQGTSFELYFPAIEPPASEQPQAPPAAKSGTGQHILYVDDERPLVNVASRTLRRLGYQVTGCSDPVSALARFRAAPAEFDVVITDLSMPLMSGLELAREILAIRADVPILMTSGYATSEDELAAQHAGIRTVIPKSNLMEYLSRSLKELFEAPRAAADASVSQRL